MKTQNTPVEIDYTNHEGERRVRRIVPIELRWDASLNYFPEPCWVVVAHDVEKQATRTFALKLIHSWNEGVA